MSSRSFRKKSWWSVVVLGTIFLSFVLKRYTQVSRGLLESKADLEIKGDHEIKGDLEIVIVYNVYLPTRRDWRPLLRNQMQDIADIGLLERAELHVSISAEVNEIFSRLSSGISPMNRDTIP